MVQRIEIAQTGGPEVMQLRETELSAPGPGMVRVRNRAVGLNYIDTYHRSGLYPLPLPSGLGLEAAGVVEAAGDGVALVPGTRVAYCAAGIGAYSEAINLPAARLVVLPDSISDEMAAAVLLKGCTVEYLLQRTYRLSAGEHCVFHAAAGGVGQLFGRWAQALGVQVIGTVGSAEKAEVARRCGYAHVINYREEDVAARVREITGGVGVPVVYDGVGAATFDASLDCLQPRGLMVSFGNASGAPPPLDLQQLTVRGSLFITRPSLMGYVASDAEMQASARDVLQRVANGTLAVAVNQRYPLADVQRAHRELEARATVGSSVLLP
ncbi:quinone oxidoreductase family protein [Chromatocurvus halotolerans]|uniref:NADPH:quinone reductase n=1 Tax=Chromatocurvus halotolerans TaxID=1132028 RepID=A0A4V2SBL1_9GAMM|nr:quinone oxidoreductase [Chromatocurvus halotolerans]TCO75950.1 NADPH2:quinone reductase [Chromatocurvus halotolerans]